MISWINFQTLLFPVIANNGTCWEHRIWEVEGGIVSLVAEWLGVVEKGVGEGVTTTTWEADVGFASSIVVIRLRFFFLSSNQFSHYYNDIIVYHVKIIQRQFYWTCFLPNLLLLGWMICDRAIKKTWAAFQSGIISYFQLACNENEKIARFVNPWRERIWNGYKGVDVLRQQLVLHVPIQQHITIVF